MAGDWVTTGSTTRTFRQTSTDRIQAQFWTPTLHGPCFGTKWSQVQILSARPVIFISINDLWNRGRFCPIATRFRHLRYARQEAPPLFICFE
jgi:hypothetical protein